MAWNEQRVWVERIEDLLIEVRELPEQFSYRVVDGHYCREVGALVAQGFSGDLTTAQGASLTAAQSYLTDIARSSN